MQSTTSTTQLELFNKSALPDATSYAIDTPLRPLDNSGHLTMRKRVPLGPTT